jgi:hypothetical protein
MYIAAAMKAKQRLISDGGRCAQSYQQEGGGVGGHRKDWLRINRQDAISLMLCEQWSGYLGMLTNDLEGTESALLCPATHPTSTWQSPANTSPT